MPLIGLPGLIDDLDEVPLDPLAFGKGREFPDRARLPL